MCDMRDDGQWIRSGTDLSDVSRRRKDDPCCHDRDIIAEPDRPIGSGDRVCRKTNVGGEMSMDEDAVATVIVALVRVRRRQRARAEKRGADDKSQESANRSRHGRIIQSIRSTRKASAPAVIDWCAVSRS